MIIDSKENDSNIEEGFMREALSLALKGKGRTSPNPCVGAVVIKNNQVVGKGFHRLAGKDHAEIEALKEAGANAYGADLYVTLEPCNHFGKTPPCCDAIIKSKIKKVIIGDVDPNPDVNGKGIRFLQDNGIEVRSGVLQKECQAINLQYNKWISTKLPYVTLKAAISLDGKIALESGESKWISNEESRRYVHKLRSETDAILVGIGTVVKDDPLLTVRNEEKAYIKKVIVLDENLRIPFSSNLFKRQFGDLVIATTEAALKNNLKQSEKIAHKLLICETTDNGQLSLPSLLKQLGANGVTSLLVEGGGKVFSSFVQNGLVDHMVLCIAPKFIGGKGKNFLPEIDFNDLSAVPRLADFSVKMLGDNLVVEGCLNA
ncbi:MAG: riboflavin biosynthesis protein RibD [Deltaproteobacteria bacterium CG07_land_8_20_14_0_80_38_7]|nr:MAG: riboflavin biosynthesis protein RibD [Deltaproteobacteria bacterium CG07_land_8_20_14_0_80_38_7]